MGHYKKLILFISAIFILFISSSMFNMENEVGVKAIVLTSDSLDILEIDELQGVYLLGRTQKNEWLRNQLSKFVGRSLNKREIWKIANLIKSAYIDTNIELLQEIKGNVLVFYVSEEPEKAKSFQILTNANKNFDLERRFKRNVKKRFLATTCCNDKTKMYASSGEAKLQGKIVAKVEANTFTNKKDVAVSESLEIEGTQLNPPPLQKNHKSDNKEEMNFYHFDPKLQSIIKSAEEVKVRDLGVESERDDLDLDDSIGASFKKERSKCNVYPFIEGLNDRCKEIESDVAVSEKDFPKLPQPPDSIQEPSILSFYLKGIIISSSTEGLEKEEGEEIEIVDLDLPGNAAILKERLKPFLNHNIIDEDLLFIKNVILEFYKEANHPLVVVRIPPQKISDGVLKIEVIEGILGGYCFKGNTYFSSALLSKYVCLQRSGCIDEIRLIEDLNLLNRNPFRRVDVIYSPGEIERTTDVEFLVKDRLPFRPYAGVENNGIESIGKERWFAGMNWGNAFGLDHLLSYQYTASFTVKRFQAHTAQYMIPLPWRNILLLYGGYSQVRADIPFFSTGKSKGYSAQASGRYLFPLRPTKTLMHDLSCGFDFKRMNNTVEFATEEHPAFDGNINISQFQLGYNFNYEKNCFKSTFNFEILASPGQLLPQESRKDYDVFRHGASSRYAYGVAFLDSLLTTKYGMLSLFLKGQYTTAKLLPSEQFGLGGYTTVRGYDEHAFNGDKGYLIKAEISSPPIQIFRRLSRKVCDDLRLLGFVDYGWTRLNKKIEGINKKEDFLIGVGPGIRYVINPYLACRVDVGFKLHRDAELGHEKHQVHFSLIVGY